MTTETFIQAMGYFSTVLILISFLMTSVVKLRLFNLIGSIIFVIFAFLTKSYPTAIMNIGLCLINIYFLIRLAKSKSLTLHLPIDRDSAYLNEFLKLYQEDIRGFFPDFNPADEKNETAFFVYYDMNPVGLIIGHKTEQGVLDIALDYTIPKYRDASVGRYLYPHLLGEEGFTALEFRNAAEKHAKYLAKVGFRREGDCYRLTEAKAKA